MKKIISICLCFLILQGCGYKPIYSKNQKMNFYIEDLSFDNGDNDLIYFIKSNLKKYLVKSNSQEFLIKARVDYAKTPISKDSTGKDDSYQLSSIVEFIILSEKKEKKLMIRESINIKNLDDEFEEKNY